MIIRNKFKKLVSIGVVSSVLVTSGGAVLSYYLTSLNSVYNSNISSAENSFLDNTTIDKRISDLQVPDTFYEIDSNQYYKNLDLKSVLSDFSNKIKNQSINNIIEMIKKTNSEFDVKNFDKDILLFLKNIYLNTNKKIGIKILKSDFAASNKVSFDYEIELKNYSSTTVSFLFDSTNLFIPANETKTLKFFTNNSDYFFNVSR
ncbi:MAG: hypothetical protein K2H11_02885, partial [Malacoplasma sp.]|nr:hypothetical protein [Malacoplasma sp.]